MRSGRPTLLRGAQAKGAIGGGAAAAPPLWCPPMLRCALLTAVCGALAAAAAAQAPATAAAITEPGRGLQRPLDMFLDGGEAKATERTLLLLLDPSPSLATAGFADAFERALADNAAALQGARLGLGVVGHKGCIVLAPGRDFARLAAEVRARLQQPGGGEFRNVDADLRAAAAACASGAGARSILLATLDNGDVEDDLEQTAQALARARVRLVVLTSEACVADSYWAARPYQEHPRGTELVGGDAPVCDLPWGWMFQITVANEVTPAGYGAYALNRLAAASGGRVHLYSAPSETQHRCSIHHACLFCNGDHLLDDAAFRDSSLRQLAPLTLPRGEALAELGRDPHFRAVVQSWRRAAQAGLLRSMPPIRLSATAASPDRQRQGRDIDLLSTTGFARLQKKAEQAADTAAELGAELQQELDRLGPAALPREEACARFTRVMLQLTRVNLLLFAAFCRDVAPAALAAEPPPPPELPLVEPEQKPVGIGFSNLGLCHGVRPFLAVELPGGDALRPELEQLAALVDDFLLRYAHTPFAFALRQMGLARFHFTYPGIAGNVPRQRPKSGAEDNPVTPRRPPRNAGGSSGGSGGPTTGGK